MPLLDFHTVERSGMQCSKHPKNKSGVAAVKEV